MFSFICWPPSPPEFIIYPAYWKWWKELKTDQRLGWNSKQEGGDSFRQESKTFRRTFSYFRIVVSKSVELNNRMTHDRGHLWQIGHSLQGLPGSALPPRRKQMCTQCGTYTRNPKSEMWLSFKSFQSHVQPLKNLPSFPTDPTQFPFMAKTATYYCYCVILKLNHSLYKIPTLVCYPDSPHGLPKHH